MLNVFKKKWSTWGEAVEVEKGIEKINDGKNEINF